VVAPVRAPFISSEPLFSFAGAAVGIALMTLTAGCGGGGHEPAKRPQYAPGPADLPFSPSVRVGHLLYLSGQIGTPPGDHAAVVAGGIEAETRQVMENIKAVLAAAGGSFDDVVKCTVMMADMREWGAMNGVYTSYFPGHKPARSSFGTTGLALGARVEIECTATVR